MNNTEIERLRRTANSYFNGKLAPIILTIIGFFTLIIGIGYLLIPIGLIWYVIDKNGSNSKDEGDIDKLIHSEMDIICNRAYEKLSVIDEQIGIVTPLCLYGPAEEIEHNNSNNLINVIYALFYFVNFIFSMFVTLYNRIKHNQDLTIKLKIGKDNKFRYSYNQFTVYFFDKNQLYIYYAGINELIKDFYNKKSFPKDILFFNMSYGLTQSYCRLQAPVLFNLLNVKYTGSSPFSVALMNNKHYTKLAVQSNDVNIPKGFMIDGEDAIDANQFNKLKYSLIIKPNNDGFSMGITSSSVVYNYDQAIEQTKILFEDFDEVIIEEYISGIDASVFLIGNKGNIVVNEVIAYKTYGTFLQKNTVRDISVKAKKLSEKFNGNEIFSKEIITKLKKISVDIFNNVHAYDIARVDYRITEDGKIFFIEINACPSLSATSDAAIVCQNMNITYPDILQSSFF